MTCSTSQLSGIMLLCCLVTACSARGALYGSQPDSGQIIEIDPVTGAVARGFAAPDENFQQVGLSGAESGSVLIWLNSSGASTQAMITRIDPGTGAVLSVHMALSSFGAPIHGLTSQPVAATNYLVSGGPSAPFSSQHGYDGKEYDEFDLGSPIESLAGDGFGRSFAGCRDNFVREFDPVSGAILNTFPLSAGWGGLAYDGTHLYATSTIAVGGTLLGMIHTLNPDTGALLRSVTIASGGPVTGLGVAVPEPASGVIAGAALLMMGRRQRHSRLPVRGIGTQKVP
jgi:hypothetical protein